MDLSEVFLQNKDFITGVARRLVKDSGLADDVAQNTWIAAWKSEKKADDLRKSWFARVARNFSIEEMRARRARSRREEKTAQTETIAGTASDLVVEEETRRLVVEAVLALEQPERTVLLLHFYRGLTLRKIAGKLEMPPSSVRKLRDRGLSVLRHRLESRFGTTEAWCAVLLPLAVLAKTPSLFSGAAAEVGDFFAHAPSLLGNKAITVASCAACLVVATLLLMFPAGNDTACLPGETAATYLPEKPRPLQSEIESSEPEGSVINIVPLAAGAPASLPDPLSGPAPEPLPTPPIATAGVFYMGRPVEGGVVSLHPDAGATYVVRNFSGRAVYYPIAEAYTDGTGLGNLILWKNRDGNEQVLLPQGYWSKEFKKGNYYFRVVATGYAPWISDPIAIDSEAPRPSIRADLCVGGSLKGKVITRPDQPPDSVVVAISRGNGFPLCLRAGVDGDYRFDHLPPGDWVGRHQTEEYPRGLSADYDAKSPPVDFTFSIFDGQTTLRDVDARVSSKGELFLVLPGWTSGGAASLLSYNSCAAAYSSLNGKPVVVSGRVGFTEMTPGRYRLEIGEIPGGIRISRNIEIGKGQNIWDNYDPALGSLEIRNCPSGVELHFIHDDLEKIHFSITIQPDSSGWAMLHNVPTGRGCIKKKGPNTGWRVLKDNIEVPGLVDLGM
jgi:RNA polymerase sigma factor (sigma-70 family)